MALSAHQTANTLAARGHADSIAGHLANATAVEYILYGALAVVALCLIVTWSLALYRRTSAGRAKKARMLALLEEAREQTQRFEIQLQTAGNRSYISTVLREIGRKSLVLESLTQADGLAAEMSVDVFFRLRDDEMGTIYQKFFCTVLSVTALGPKRARIELSMPSGLKLGQKRNFYRIKPMPRAVRVLALWLQPHDLPLPQNTSQIGQPLFSFTNQADLFAPEEPEDDKAKSAKDRKKAKEAPAEEIFIPVEDISASGMGLRLPKPENMDSLEVGMHLLCLLVYNESNTEANLVRFWCVGKVVNIREPKDDFASVILGMEFFQWAVLEPDSKEIHWFPNAPKGGVGPITQWVIKQDLEQNCRS